MEETNKQKLGKNAVFNLVKYVSSVIFPLITFPYITRVLGVVNVGKINFGNSIIGYISMIATLGITTYAVRECSKVKSNKEELSKLASQILSINIVTTIISYIILALLLIFAKNLYDYRTLIIIQSTAVLFTTLGADWLNSALEDFKYITYRTLAFQFISLILMLIFVKKPDDYLKYALIVVISSSGGNICNIFYRKKYCDTVFTFDMHISEHVKPVLTMFALTLSQSIFTNLDTTMIGLFRGDAEVGYYSMAMKIYGMVNMMIASIVYVVLPQLSFHYKTKDYDNINKLLKYVINYIVILGFPCLVGMMIMAPDLVVAVGGEQYLPSGLTLRILTIALGISFFGGFFQNMVFMPSGRERVPLFSCIIAAIVNAILNYILIPKYGYNAAAFTTVIAESTSIIISTRFVESEIHIDNILDIIKCPLIGCLAIALLCIVIKHVIVSFWPRVIISILVSILAYFLVLVIGKDRFTQEALSPILKKLQRDTK